MDKSRISIQKVYLQSAFISYKLKDIFCFDFDNYGNTVKVKYYNILKIVF